MKRLLFVIVVAFCSSNIFPQYGEGFPVKQIASFSYNVKNPRFFENSFYEQNDLLFESHIGSSINIGLLSYDSEKDTFFNPIKITDNSGHNLNPMGIKLNRGEIVFYQTNVKGTWDIAYREFKNNQWGMPKILVDSTGDETNPSFIYNQNNSYPDSIKIFFEKDSSIFMLAKKDSLIRIDTIFTRSDSLRYSQPTGQSELVYDNNKWKEKIDCVSKQTNAQNKSRIVQATFLDMKKISEKVLIDSGEVNNPKFQITDYRSNLTFENKLSGFSNIYFMNINNNSVQQLKDNPDGDLISFSSSSAIMVITKSFMNKTVNKLIFSPHTFILRRNDSTFVRINNFKSYYYPADSMIYTKITNNTPVVASVGFSSYWQVFYYVWEDSIDGRINLVGRKELQPLGAVEPETAIKGYYLYQNYPNPFNPYTKIKFYLAKNGFVKIIVYNILGERVTTLLNDYLFSGEHEIEFNRKSLHQELSSGIYFYQLKSGKYTSVKKMILLK